MHTYTREQALSPSHPPTQTHHLQAANVALSTTTTQNAAVQHQLSDGQRQLSELQQQLPDMQQQVCCIS